MKVLQLLEVLLYLVDPILILIFLLKLNIQSLSTSINLQHILINLLILIDLPSPKRNNTLRNQLLLIRVKIEIIIAQETVVFDPDIEIFIPFEDFCLESFLL